MWDKPDAIASRTNLRADSPTAPQALVGSNHHRAPFPERFQMFEKDLPGQPPPINAEQSVSTFRWNGGDDE